MPCLGEDIPHYHQRPGCTEFLEAPARIMELLASMHYEVAKLFIPHMQENI